MPIFYFFLSLAFAVNAHQTSEHSGVQSWQKENPPTLAMITGELSQKGFTMIRNEKISRQLYRTFPFKNANKGALYASHSPQCIAYTSEPETIAIPYFFCASVPLKSDHKLDWHPLGVGWLGVIELQKMKVPPKKQISPPISYDPREIRY